jgi:hypothetical protein
MGNNIPESDWKVFRKLHPVALERFCQRVLSEVSRLAADDSKTSHERYLAVFKLIKQRDGEIADAFNDFRRSTAVRQLAAIQLHELLSDEELAGFSPETRNTVQALLEIWKS